MALVRQISSLILKVPQGSVLSPLSFRGVHSSSSLETLPPISSIPTVSTGGRTKCTLVPGDGVGPELVYSVQEVFKVIKNGEECNQELLMKLTAAGRFGFGLQIGLAAGIPVDWEMFFLSEVNRPLSAPLENVAESIFKNGICLKGILATPDYSHTGELETLNMKLRKSLDLYANVVHVKSLHGIKMRHKNIDCVVIREQTEGEYSALEHETVKGVVECLKIVTANKSSRIAKFAFDYATKNNRKRVTAVHKANIMKLGDGLFLKSCKEMAQLYPKIEFETMIVDNCTMQMVSNPHQFDVMVMPNLYGNIIDNLASGLVGGAGVVAGASYSPECVVFEPGARHTYSEAVGKNVANPTAMMLCAAKMLAHVNLGDYAMMIRKAIAKVLTDGKVRTKDLGGQSTTNEYTYAIIANLGK